MASDPLAYDGLKCVLQFMEPNKRIQVSNKCPSIRTTERVVPLRLKSLMLSEGEVRMNTTTYRIEIYQHHYTGNARFFKKIQITVHSDDGYAYVERYHYNGIYRNAIKQLPVFLFGGRRHPIYSKCLTGGGNDMIPAGVQFQFDEISCWEAGTVLDTLKPILHEPSLPLKRLNVGQLSITDLVHPIVQKTKSLKVLSLSNEVLTVTLLKKIENQTVILSVADTEVSGADVLELVEDWVRTGRPIGANFIFHGDRKWVFENSIRTIQTRFGEAVVNGDFTIIPMPNASQLRISYAREVSFERRLTGWNMHMLVEAMEKK